MANVKITDLAAYTNPDSTDVLPIVDVGADVTKKVSIADLLENAGSGTASAPGIAFDGDSNTGIYRPGADQLALATNGTGRLFIDSSGNVGLGTSGPQEPLQVYGSAPNTDIAHFGRTGGNLRGLIIGTRAAGAVDDAQVLLQAPHQSGTISLWTANSQRVTVTNDGNVGIGTTSPSQLLHLRGGAPVFLMDSTTNTSQIDLKNTLTTARFQAVNSDLAILLGGTERARIDSFGNVGIGTNSVVAKLHVSNSGAEGIEIHPGYATNLNYTSNYNRSTSSYIDLAQDALRHRFYISGTERARIDSSGRLLVGTSTFLTDRKATSNRVSTLGILQPSGESGLVVITNQTSATDSVGGRISLQRFVGANTAVLNADELGSIVFGGSTGDGSTTDRNAAEIGCEVDGTPGANDMPGRLVFSTTADGSSSPTERMRITSAGDLLVGATSRSSKLGNNSIEGANYKGYFIRRYTVGSVYSGNSKTITITFPDQAYSSDYPTMGTIEAGIQLNFGASTSPGSNNIRYVKRIRDFITSSFDIYTSDSPPQQVWLNNTLDMTRGSDIDITFSVSGRVVTVTFINNAGAGQLQTGVLVLKSSAAPSSVVTS